jgi:hypothetical protein
VEIAFLAVTAYVVVETIALIIAAFRKRPTGFRVVTYVIMIIAMVTLWLLLQAQDGTMVT